MTEAQPDPHNEREAAGMPVQSDQRQSTGEQNTGQTPSTAEDKIHPSVAEGVEGASTAGLDSMFNEADPQASELSGSPRKRNPQPKVSQSRKKPRKAA